MSPVWNPNAGSGRINGLEWRVQEQRAVDIRASIGHGVVLDAASSGAVDGVAVYTDEITDPLAGAAYLWVDVYDITAGLPPEVPETITTVRPVADQGTNGNTTTYPMPGYGGSLWQSPDTWRFLNIEHQAQQYVSFRTLVPSIGLYGSGEFSQQHKFSGTDIGALSGRRITGVHLDMVFGNPSLNNLASQAWVYLTQIPTQLRSTIYLGSIAPGDNPAVRGTWTLNPYTRLPWTVADIALFSNGSPTTGWVGGFIGKPSGYGALAQALEFHLRVASVIETRAAYGFLQVNAGPAGWRRLAMTALPASPPFKTAGRKYLYVFRTIYDAMPDVLQMFGRVPTTFAQGTIPTLDSGDTTIIKGSYVMPLDRNGGAIRYAGVTPRLHTTSSGVVPLSGASPYADAQPYAELYARTIKNAGVSAEQDFRTNTTRAYGTVRAQLGWLSGRQPSDPLLIRIKVRSSGATVAEAQVASDSGLSPDLITGQPTSIRVYVGAPTGDPANPGAPVTLTAGTQYYVEFTATPTDTWQVYGLDDRSGGGYSTANFGGATDNEHYDAADNATRDLMVTVGVAPPAPVLAPIVVT